MKKALEKLELVDNLNDAVYTVDVKSLSFTSLNRAGEKLTGYKKAEILNKPIILVIAPQYLPLVKKMIAKKQRKDIATIYEIEIVRKDGSMVPVEISSKAKFENGKPTEIMGVARDVSERKLHQQERDVFISLITHEIKNPLTTIKLYTELLGKKLAKDKKNAEYFSTISENIRKIEDLMNDFLGITQMQVGKFVIVKEKYDLNEEIDKLIKAVQRYAPQKIHRVGEITSFVNADKNRINQVISNLLSNAIKYSPDSEEIIVEVSNTKENVAVNVKDFGVGISKEDRKNIFELFTRTKHASQSQIQGHGIGLYFCREIIKYHKGKIGVVSVLGKGSTFYFTIPIR
jgi:PAS domain S-box-containing protein